MAARRPVVEKAARELEVGVKVRAVLEKVAVGRLRATSIFKGFADAMMGLLVAMVWLLGRGCCGLEIRSAEVDDWQILSPDWCV